MRSNHQLGDTYGSVVSWRWDRARMVFLGDAGEHDIVIHFHKVGGRWSVALPDGTPNVHSSKSYWTFEIDCDRDSTKFSSADDAKDAACAEYRRRFGKVG